MSILTDEEIMFIEQTPSRSYLVHARAIESAVLAKLREQEPDSWEYQDKEGNWKPFINEAHRENTINDGSWPTRKLYSHPMPPKEQK